MGDICISNWLCQSVRRTRNRRRMKWRRREIGGRGRCVEKRKKEICMTFNAGKIEEKPELATVHPLTVPVDSFRSYQAEPSP